MTQESHKDLALTCTLLGWGEFLHWGFEPFFVNHHATIINSFGSEVLLSFLKSFIS
jgi:hypothetical protein